MATRTECLYHMERGLQEVETPEPLLRSQLLLWRVVRVRQEGYQEGRGAHLRLLHIRSEPPLVRVPLPGEGVPRQGNFPGVQEQGFPVKVQGPVQPIHERSGIKVQ